MVNILHVLNYDIFSGPICNGCIFFQGIIDIKREIEILLFCEIDFLDNKLQVDYPFYNQGKAISV